MSIFSKVAMPRPQHNIFDLSHSRKFSMSIGKITPISVMEAVPGDSFDIKTTQLVRFAPLLAPIMHVYIVTSSLFQTEYYGINGKNTLQVAKTPQTQDIHHQYFLIMNHQRLV